MEVKQEEQYRESFKYCDLQITLSKNLKKKPEFTVDMPFGQITSDHMFMVDWNNKTGWECPKIVPFHLMDVDPRVEAICFGVQGFEGMKAFKDKDNNLRMFRPIENMKRLINTSKGLGLAGFDPEELLKCIMKLIVIEQAWVPKKKNYSLYIRPGVMEMSGRCSFYEPATRSRICVSCCPVGPYFKTGFNAVRIITNPKWMRCSYGGTGAYKFGANYCQTIIPEVNNGKQGYQGILWTYKDEVSEVSSMNLFFHWINSEGQEEVVTSHLKGLTLPGITRKSVIQLLREQGLDVVEKKYTLTEVLAALKDKRVKEIFGTGTAAVVCPIKSLTIEDVEYKVLDDKKSKAGPLAAMMHKTITDIQTGRVKHDWGIVIDKNM